MSEFPGKRAVEARAENNRACLKYPWGMRRPVKPPYYEARGQRPLRLRRATTEMGVIRERVVPTAGLQGEFPRIAPLAPLD